MTSDKLTNDLMVDTSAMHLTLKIGAGRLDVEIVGPTPELTRLNHSETLAEASVQSVENALYDNPLVLNDFEAVDVILTGHDFFTMPRGVGETIIEQIADILLPDFEGKRIILSRAKRSLNFCFAVDAALYNFLRRTYPYAEFHHSLELALNDDTPGLIAAYTGNGGIDIVINNADRSLAYLNRPHVNSPADCVYYILAARGEAERIYLAADPDSHEAIQKLIHQVAPHVEVLPKPLSHPTE